MVRVNQGDNQHFCHISHQLQQQIIQLQQQIKRLPGGSGGIGVPPASDTSLGS
jgi:hypothetical protein